MYTCTTKWTLSVAVPVACIAGVNGERVEGENARETGRVLPFSQSPLLQSALCLPLPLPLPFLMPAMQATVPVFDE